MNAFMGIIVYLRCDYPFVQLQASSVLGESPRPPPPPPNSDTASVLQIVANNRNGLDVDKYDYLQRDSLYCNTKISVDIKRIFSFVKVLAPCTSALLGSSSLYQDDCASSPL